MIQDLNDETDADISKILEKLYGLKGITPLHENQPKTEPKTRDAQTRNRDSPKVDEKPIMNGGSSGKVQNGEKLEFQPPPNKIAKSESPDKMTDKIADKMTADKKSTDQNDKLDNLTSQAASMLPVGLTLSENHVSTTIPDLLRGKLR